MGNMGSRPTKFYVAHVDSDFGDPCSEICQSDGLVCDLYENVCKYQVGKACAEDRDCADVHMGRTACSKRTGECYIKPVKFCTGCQS